VIGTQGGADMDEFTEDDVDKNEYPDVPRFLISNIDDIDEYPYLDDEYPDMDDDYLDAEEEHLDEDKEGKYALGIMLGGLIGTYVIVAGWLSEPRTGLAVWAEFIGILYLMIFFPLAGGLSGSYLAKKRELRLSIFTILVYLIVALLATIICAFDSGEIGSRCFFLGFLVFGPIPTFYVLGAFLFYRWIKPSFSIP
jgi:hypothetical protein